MWTNDDGVQVRDLAATQGGMVTRSQLIDIGLSDTTIGRWVEHGLLTRRHRGVFAFGAVPKTKETVWWAAQLAAGDRSALCGRASAARQGFREDHGSQVELVVPGTGGPRVRPGLRVYRSATLEGMVVERDGLRTTTPARTLVELAGSLPKHQMHKAAREAFRLKLLTVEELREAVDGHERRRGLAKLRLFLDEHLTLLLGRCRSPRETLGLQQLHEAGWPWPLVNEQLNGFEVDFHWPDLRLIHEVDSSYHDDLHARAKDEHRDAVHFRVGWNTHRWRPGPDPIPKPPGS